MAITTRQQFFEKNEELTKKMSELTNPDDILYVRNQLVELNLRLVSEILRRHKPYTADQFQIGCIGLIKAADTYNIVRGVPFSSYACFVIERELQKEHFNNMRTFEGKMQGNFVYLDEITHLSNGDEVETGSLIEDVEATRYMETFIEENSLDVICENIIKPAIKEVAERGKNAQSKINFEVWEQLEFRYIMATVFEESQKNRFNLTQMAKECNISLPNVRMRHMRVKDVVFQRMWSYMTLSFTDLLERLRGDHKIPERLLCLDPGKTTGWCVFEKGQLTKWGQVENCYDDKNIDIKGMMNLFEEIQPDFILYEDYRVYNNKLERHAFSPVMTVRLLGLIETYCQMNNIPSHKQMATTAKNFCTDAKLEAWGFWQRGMRHARDAIRHGTYFLLFYKKGEDIL